MSFWSFLVFIGGVLVGAVTLLGLQALGVYVIIKRLNRKIQQHHDLVSSPSTTDLDPQQSLHFVSKKKGLVWVLESDNIPKFPFMDEVSKDQKKKKEVYEVSPVRKHAKIVNRFFVLTNSDGSHTPIPLDDCTVQAVSATDLPSKKWAKRFPIKVEYRTSDISSGSKTVYIFLETSWEKEAWCKALRLASCHDKEQIKWFSKLNEDFQSYVMSLNVEYPFRTKPSLGTRIEPIDGDDRLDGSTSKVRMFLKKMARKASKAGLENRGTSFSVHEEKRPYDIHRSLEGSGSASSSLRKPMSKNASSSQEGDDSQSLHASPRPSVSRSTSQNHTPAVSDVEIDDKLTFDEGTLCWNLLMSRLFYDARSNVEIKRSVQARIQRTLSNMRTPTYIGEVICSGLDLGNLPPHILSMRVLPTEMNEVWAWEVDIEYCGGVVLDVETRLDVSSLDFQKGMEDTSSESSSAESVSSELIEGFENFERQLNMSEGNDDAQGKKDDEVAKLDGSKSSLNFNATAHKSRWKTIVNSIAKQVSQVSLSLSIRVSSLRGTVRFHLKPPPSDQLWFGFTSMPDIDFKLESAVGEHKIASGRVALFLISKFKASIRDTIVLPNCESICIPWMLAEKNDWVPRKVAPFMWVKQDPTFDPAILREALRSEPEKKPNLEASKGKSNDDIVSKNQPRNTDIVQRSLAESPSDALTTSSEKLSMQNSSSSPDLRTPLLASSEQHEASKQSREDNIECQSPSMSVSEPEKQNRAIEEGDLRSKKMGTRARMLDLGKKMGEKFEEKRRHIEEKGRNIVEKMRGPQS